MQQAYDYLAEANELATILQDRPDRIFAQTTLFKSWTINDVIGHLYMFDVAALKSLQSTSEFEIFFSQITERLNRGMSILESQYPYLKDLSGRRLFQKWNENSDELSAAYAKSDPKKRLRWVGPDMSAKSSITARQMETWAHGQEVFDTLGIIRPAHDRIKNICHLGVATFGWSFKNRNIRIPHPAPYVSLESPSGKIWEWNDPASPYSVNGYALEFSQVVTQVRNIKDTSLEIRGDVATQWMEIAQCFAGKPENPPLKSTRFTRQKPI